jgi:hypothetical protein
MKHASLLPSKVERGQGQVAVHNLVCRQRYRSREPLKSTARLETHGPPLRGRKGGEGRQTQGADCRRHYDPTDDQ